MHDVHLKASISVQIILYGGKQKHTGAHINDDLWHSEHNYDPSFDTTKPVWERYWRRVINYCLRGDLFLEQGQTKDQINGNMEIWI